MSTKSITTALVALLLLVLPSALSAQQMSPNIEEIIRQQVEAAFAPLLPMNEDLLVTEDDTTEPPSGWKNHSAFNCFPTCDVTDGRFLVIADGTAFNSFSDEAQVYRISVEAGSADFILGIFDGDGRELDDGESRWDLGVTAPFKYTLYADPLGDGTGTTVVNLDGAPSAMSTTMPNDAWKDFVIPTGPEAQAPSGAFFYLLKIELDDEMYVTMNAFKLRTTGHVTVDPQVISYIANFADLTDGFVIYPSLPSPTPTTYDGSFNFYFEVPADQSEIVVWDGDFDRGKWDGTEQDTDDPDTPPAPFLPVWSSGDAVSEAVAIGDFGTTGAPRDDMDPSFGGGFGTYQLRSPSIRWDLVTSDGQSFANENPSGNQEWEQFRVALGPLDPAQSDYSATSLPAGVYRMAIQGVDMQNLNAVRLPFRALCVDGHGTPCFPAIQPFLVGDTVFYDVDGDGVQGPGELGIPGVTVTLYSAGGQVLGTATTDANGNYSFEVAAGTYTVEVDSSNYDAGGALESLSSTTGDSLTFDVVDDNVLDFDYGYLGSGSIGDFVWEDSNGDGAQDAGEPGIGGITVTLEADLDGDGVIDFTQTTVTDANGGYIFGDLPPGDYTVTVDGTTLPDTVGGQTYDLDGVLDNTTTVSLGAGENRTDLDFGYEGLGFSNPGTGTIGYWKNHLEAWPVDEITLGGITYSADEAVAIAKGQRGHKNGDKSYTLWLQLMGATLNVILGNDSTCISDTIDDANAWLVENPLGSGVKGGSKAWKNEGDALKTTLDEYNNGLLCAPHRG